MCKTCIPELGFCPCSLDLHILLCHPSREPFRTRTDYTGEQLKKQEILLIS